MKKLLIFIFWVGLIILAYYFGLFDFILTNAGINTGNIFIPSRKNINSINNQSSNFSDGKVASKTFNEYTENTIDKNGFYLRIDKIDLFKRIIENVDPRNKTEYIDSWNYGISHGKFTSTPDKIGITYLFSHAVSNKAEAGESKAWFTYMDMVKVGDEVIIYYKSKKYTYSVTEVLVVKPTDTGFYTGASPVPKVRMQFCGPPTGSLDSRTLVDAVLLRTDTFNV